MLCRAHARYNAIYELVPKKLLKQDAEELGCTYKKYVALGGGQENDCEVLITMFLLIPTGRLENRPLLIYSVYFHRRRIISIDAS